ncbi:NAD(P)-binding domain-containing protein, partial [Candidatus Kapabacteria bacterium]|nr:NAD(P)-binding domain-containing protein [Candidatus Kapabacteria bacterium]
MIESDKIAVIGSGSWGTALANYLYKCKKEVILYSRSKEFAEQINSLKINDKHLPGQKLSNLEVRHISEYNDEK